MAQPHLTDQQRAERDKLRGQRLPEHLRTDNSTHKPGSLAHSGRDSSHKGSLLGRVAKGAAGLLSYYTGKPADGLLHPVGIYNRLRACESCEHSTPKEKPVFDRTCGKMVSLLGGRETCGCGLGKKAALPSESCPLEKPKWIAVTINKKNPNHRRPRT